MGAVCLEKEQCALIVLFTLGLLFSLRVSNGELRILACIHHYALKKPSWDVYCWSLGHVCFLFDCTDLDSAVKP